MLKDIFNRVTFIHGWLFGNYIWTNVIDYFDSINNKNFVTFNGYSDNSNEFDREDKVKLILNSTNKDDLIIAYSFGASAIALRHHREEQVPLPARYAGADSPHMYLQRHKMAKLGVQTGSQYSAPALRSVIYCVLRV